MTNVTQRVGARWNARVEMKSAGAFSASLTRTRSSNLHHHYGEEAIGSKGGRSQNARRSGPGLLHGCGSEKDCIDGGASAALRLATVL